MDQLLEEEGKNRGSNYKEMDYKTEVAISKNPYARNNSGSIKYNEL